MSVAGLMLVVGLAALPAAAAPLAPPASTAEFLARHCADCHTGKDAEAGFDLAGLSLGKHVVF